jgi:outer membrane protein assembly factor BamB
MSSGARVITLGFALCIASACYGDPWPQFRGLNRDGKSKETGLLKKWPEGGPKLLWYAKGLGKGFSSVAIADGYIYTTGMVGKDKQGILFAYDTEGVFKWKVPYGPAWSGPHSGARTTPTVDGNSVYVISGYGNLVCFNAKTSRKKWEVDVLKRFKGKNIKWGISESVLICGDNVICTPGGENASVVALNKMTGKTVWTSKGLSDSSAYCSPILVEEEDRKLVVTITASHIVGIDPADGEVLWRHQNKIREGKPRHINPNCPIYHDKDIYATSRFVGGTKLKLHEDRTKISEIWVDENLDPHHGGVVLVGGFIYGANSKRDNWLCLDWATGQRRYEQEWGARGSIIYADGMLYCYESEKGTVALVKASPKGFDIVSSFRVSHGTGDHWAHPAISDGRLYIRHGNALMAYDISSPDKTTGCRPRNKTLDCNQL